MIENIEQIQYLFNSLKIAAETPDGQTCNLRACANAPTPIIGSRALIVLTTFDLVWVDALGALKVSTL